MSARLYAGADPVDLVPGSLEAMHADADDLDAAAARLGAVGRDIDHQVIASWFGRAAEGWPERRTTLVAVADGVADVYALAAQVLRAHADAVVWARLQAQIAVELWEEADRRSFTTAEVCFAPARPRAFAEGPRLGSGSGAALSPPTIVAPPDPGAATRDLARQVLESALRDVSRSATAAAEVLDALSEGLPDGRWHAGQFAVGVWSWIYGIGSLVARFSYIRATLAREGWYADAEAMRQDLLVTAEFLAANPDETGAVLLDSQGLRDNPARWWGAMAPDLALSLVSGGAAASTRLGRALRVVNGHRTPVLPAARPWGDLVAGLELSDRSRIVRMVLDEAELRSLFWEMTELGESLPPNSPKLSEVYRLPDGTRIQWRPTSGSGGPTVDIFPAEGDRVKIHVTEY